MPIEAISFEEVHNAKSVLHPGSHVRHPEVVPLGVSFGVQVHPKYQLVIIFAAVGVNNGKEWVLLLMFTVSKLHHKFN